MSYFKNKVIWVTGASSGIGYATVLELSKKGAKSIVISGRNEDRLRKLSSEVPDVNCLILAFDVVEREQHQKAVNRIKEYFGQLDIVFFNAGGAGDIDKYEANTFSSDLLIEIMTLNYFSMLYGIEASLPLLKQSHAPQIIGMSSVASYHGLPDIAGYCASKAAARIFLQSLAIDLLPDRIAVSIVCPGFVKTPLTDGNPRHLLFLLSAEQAARIIVHGIQRQQAEIHFPKRLCWLFNLVCCLPRKMTRRLLQRAG